MADFTGENAKRVNSNSPVPIDFRTGDFHIKGDGKGNVDGPTPTKSIMVPGIGKGERFSIQPLDIALLRDIGYEEVSAGASSRLNLETIRDGLLHATRWSS